MQVDIDRKRLGDADGVTELDGGAIGEAGGDDVLGEVARRVGGRAVDLGGILAREGATTMRSRATVGVDDDLAAGEAGIAIGTSDDELAGRIDVPDGILRNPAVRQCRADIGLDDLADIVRAQRGIDVLGGDDNLGDGDRYAVLVAHGDLALGIGAELDRSAFAHLAGNGERLEDLMGVVDRGGQQLGRLAAGVAEHDALVAGADILVAGLIDTLRDIGRLAVQQHVDLGGLPVETSLLVADCLDRLAGGGLELGRIDHRMAGGVDHHLAVLALPEQRLGNPDFAGDHDAVGGGQRLAGDADPGRIHAGLLGLTEHQVDDLVADPVANLVGMTLGNRFRSEQIGRPRHAKPPKTA